MRYVDRITLVTETEGGFNPNTGNHDKPIRHEDTLPCNLNSVGIDRAVKLFGNIDIAVTVARLQVPYNKPYDYVMLNGERVNVKRHVKHRKQSAFYLEGAL